MSKENISIETESFEKEGEQVRIRCSPSNNCIVNHLVLEQIASLLSCHRHRVKYISHSTNNLYITTRFFFFFSFCRFHYQAKFDRPGFSPLPFGGTTRQEIYTATAISSWLPRRGKETNDGWKEGEELCQRRRRGCNTAHGNRNPGRAGRPRQLVSST